VIESPGQVLRRHGLWARKSWGQNFLHDPHVLASIVRASGAAPGRRVVEIGAGVGTLTGHLLETGATVHAIERDRDLCEVLRAELGENPGFILHEADAVRFDYAALAGDAPIDVVGNLPYHLTGPLLFMLLHHHAVTGRWVVMVQREVAQRLCAVPGTKAYGGLTVAMSRLRSIDWVVDAPRGAFVPAPRVDSAVVRLDPRPQPRGEVKDAEGYLDLVRRAFQQRRKTLLNALTAIGDRDHARAWLAAAGIEPGVRPERLTPEQFAAIQRAREAEPVADA
jgi:16S rRNA (adenine1518-N6/adenine1519-N6)-dimethyltransferase